MEEKIIGKAPKFSLDDTEPVKCECGCNHFIEVIELRKISKLLVGAPEDQLVNVPALMCAKCHKILDLENV